MTDNTEEKKALEVQIGKVKKLLPTDEVPGLELTDERIERIYEQVENISFSDIEVHDGYRYTREDKIQAVTVFLTCRSARRTAGITGIPYNTLMQWRSEDWWPEVEKRLQTVVDEEMQWRMTGLLDGILTNLYDRLANGDEVLDRNNELIQKKISGKELANIFSIVFDKRALSRGDPTSRSESSSSTRLEDLTKTFEKIANSKKEEEDDGYNEFLEAEVIKREPERSEGDNNG